jgi:LmbE family N-acetylglucosaminyl deacetylase
MVSVANGDKGHFSPEYAAFPTLLAARRMEEAQRAVAVIGAEFATLNVHDGEVEVTLPWMEAMIRLIRGFGPAGQGPDLVVFNRPTDYHRDHRYTSQLVLDATYMLTVPLCCLDAPHLERMPIFAYWWDRFTEGGAFRPDVVVPIDAVLSQKIDMAQAHESQVFEWLPYNAGRLDEVPADAAARREYVARRVRERAAHIRQHCAAQLEELFGPNEYECAEAFQISEYGRQPDAAELRRLFPLPSK